VTIVDPREAHLSDTSFSAYGNVTGRDVEQIIAWVESPSGEITYGQPIQQQFTRFDWGFHFVGLQSNMIYRLMVEARNSCCCTAQDKTNVIHLSFAATVTVQIGCPPGDPAQVTGSYFETAGWVSDKNATRTAKITQNGSAVTNGTGTAIDPGPFFDWRFSFTGVPATPPSQMDVLTVTATPSTGSPGSATKHLRVV
jgi:hypothetical protein